MPLVFRRDEIQEFLCEMGYCDLKEEALDQFVKDLRKLIKAESRQRRRTRLGHDEETTPGFSSTEELELRPKILFRPASKLRKSKIMPGPEKDYNSYSDYATSHENNTSDSFPQSSLSASNGAETSGGFTKTSQTSVSSGPLQDSNNYNRRTEMDAKKVKRDGTRSSAACTRAPPLEERLSFLRAGPDQQKKHKAGKVSSETQPPTDDVDVTNENQNSTSGTSETVSDTDLLCLMEHILKNECTGFLDGTGDNGTSAKKKIEIPLKIRRDPVALYHWYKTFWDKQKPPGEDRHMQLRWNVRAGTVGRYPCDADGVPIDYLRLKPFKTKKKTVNAL